MLLCCVSYYILFMLCLCLGYEREIEWRMVKWEKYKKKFFLIYFFFLNNDLEVHVFIYGIPLLLISWNSGFFLFSFLDLYVHSLYFYIHKILFTFHLFEQLHVLVRRQKKQQQKIHILYIHVSLFLFPYSILSIIYGAPCDRERKNFNALTFLLFFFDDGFQSFIHYVHSNMISFFAINLH